MPVTDDDAKADAKDAKIEATADAKAEMSEAKADAKAAQTGAARRRDRPRRARPGCSRAARPGDRLARGGPWRSRAPASTRAARAPICSSRSPS